MPSVPTPAAARPPVLPPAARGKAAAAAANAVNATPNPPTDATPAAKGKGGRPKGGNHGPSFNWNQDRLNALVDAIVNGGVKTAAELQTRLATHPAFEAEAHLLKREGILRWVATLQDQYVEQGRPDLAAKLELRKSGSGWKPDLGALATIMGDGVRA